ncbi:hypothetical protein BGZ50_004680 [Haplosporangium sp. Z 11]|nr:hypothetical protein BGZ50_004680 [Haplosporangium sp. Z 11]
MVTEEALINYGNMKQPYCPLRHREPIREYITSVLVLMTAQDATCQLAMTEKVGALINADVDTRKLDYMNRSKYAVDIGDWEEYEDEYGATKRG